LIDSHLRITTSDFDTNRKKGPKGLLENMTCARVSDTPKYFGYEIRPTSSTIQRAVDAFMDV